MTIKHINGAVSGGYTLSAAYSGLIVGASGAVTGFDPILAGSGGAGVTFTFAASLTNSGSIVGGLGHHAGPLGKFNLPAGDGGAGVDAAAGSAVANSLGKIVGGVGGSGSDQYGGGAGGIGIMAGAGSTIIDSGSTVIGQGVVLGGHGGAALTASALAGGAGGSGVDLASGQVSVLGGFVYGGGGGSGDGAAAGGAGGAGVVLETSGTVVTDGHPR